jgi:hypothetical protein
VIIIQLTRACEANFDIDSMSTVAVGRAYERIVLNRLTLFGLRLSSVGGAFDQGVDLVGLWTLPSPVNYSPLQGDRVMLTALSNSPPSDAAASLSVPAVVQCKATSSPVGVRTMREFQHAVAERYPMGTIAVLASSGGFAMRGLVKEREWALRKTLLLHISGTGDLLSAASISGRGDDNISFIVRDIAVQ